VSTSSFRIASRDQSATVELSPDGKTIKLEHRDPGLATRVSFEGPLGDLGQKASELRASSQEAKHRLDVLGDRAAKPLRSSALRLLEVARWLIRSGERTNHTYDLTTLSKTYLAHAVSLVTGQPVNVVMTYIAEAESDRALSDHLLAARNAQPPDLRAASDPTAWFGRRLGWYAVVRSVKPSLVVETGVDKGLGAVMLCAALRRNRAEGHAGRYLGTDLNPNAGYLLSGAYAEVGGVAFGDSLQSLAKVNAPIDVFINDSDHNPEYEAREYRMIQPKLSDGAVVLSDNAHSTQALSDFAAVTGRRFLFWQERPKDHWYPGAGIGFAFR
jgi:hypothetical protein